jgi:hypothetical protein
MSGQFAAVGLALTFACLMACSGGSKDSPTSKALTSEQRSAKEQVDVAVEGAKKTAANYKAMNNDALLQKLMEQSVARKEPFNSPAYREMAGRDLDPKSLVAAVTTANGGDALLPLLLLRKQNQQAYLGISPEARAKVLTDALATSNRFNTWGLPNTYSEDAPKALLEVGDAATAALERLLSDTRPAPLFGSKEYMIYRRYQFRVCDYAFAYLEKIEGKDAAGMPVSPSDRDALIKSIIK